MFLTRYASRRSLRFELSLGLAALVSLGILVVGSLLYQHQRYALERRGTRGESPVDWKPWRRRREVAEGDFLNGIVRDACLLVRATARERHVRLEEHLAPGLPEVAVDRQGFVQVLLNLFTNALDAVADGRADAHIRVTTAIGGSPGGTRSIEIIVSDNGPGIPPNILPLIFEPFFSTKEPGRGTGLGLAISKEIVERHGGSIRVETVAGGGARIVVSAPVQPAPRPESPVAAVPARA